MLNAIMVLALLAQDDAAVKEALDRFKQGMKANTAAGQASAISELARTPHDFTYWVTFFDGEEARGAWTSADSLYGSRHLAAELASAQRLPRAMLLVDMIGDRDLSIKREAFSTAWLTDVIWDTARRLGYGRYFLADVIPVEDDHAPFLRAGVPAALLIDFDYPPWHTAQDTLDKVSAKSLAIVGEVVREALPAVEQALLRHR